MHTGTILVVLAALITVACENRLSEDDGDFNANFNADDSSSKTVWIVLAIVFVILFFISLVFNVFLCILSRKRTAQAIHRQYLDRVDYRNNHIVGEHTRATHM